MRHLLLLTLLAGPFVTAGCGGSMPRPMDDDRSSDGSGGDGGLVPFGQPTMATAATDCPMPPTSGTCNMQGYCKP